MEAASVPPALARVGRGLAGRAGAVGGNEAAERGDLTLDRGDPPLEAGEGRGEKQRRHDVERPAHLDGALHITRHGYRDRPGHLRRERLAFEAERRPRCSRITGERRGGFGDLWPLPTLCRRSARFGLGVGRRTGAASPIWVNL